MRMLRILALAALLALTGLPAAAQLDSPLWQPWAALDLNALGDDNSGSSFTAGTADGLPALTITPGGSAEETKLAYPVSGAGLQPWRDFSVLQMEVYLPPGNARNPDSFFLGLGDVTRGWAWAKRAVSCTSATIRTIR